MLLEEFFQYKNTLMKMFCTNEEIVRLVSDDEDTDGLSLPYKQIFPFEFIPETTDRGKTYI